MPIDGEGKKVPTSIKFVTHPAMMKLGKVTTSLKKNPKNFNSRDTHNEFY